MLKIYFGIPESYVISVLCERRCYFLCVREKTYSTKLRKISMSDNDLQKKIVLQ